MTLLQSLLDKVEVAVVFLVMISVLVAAHEYGHYLLARIFRMGTEEFAIGFGRKPIWVWMRKRRAIKLTAEERRQQGLAPDEAVDEETLFTVRAWPLGGFVRIKGMVPQDDGSEVSIPGGFYSKPAWQRFLVLLAGPVFSVGSGILLIFITTLVVGVPSREPIVMKVAPGSPAAIGGIRENDRVVSLDSRQIKSAEDVTKFDRKPGVPILVGYERDGKRNQVLLVPVHLSVDAKLGLSNPNDVRLGIQFGKMEPAPVGPAFVNAVSIPYLMVSTLVSQLSTHKVAVEDTVGGPASMVSATSDAVHNGLEAVVETAALLSISVGIFNMLPVGPLDGGQMMLAFIELFRRRRLSMQTQTAFMNIGAMIVLTMVLCVIVVDAKRFLPFGKDKPTATQSSRPAK